ncbi:MAG: LysM peptidoglycan-binding domain-containing protein [Planctomycetes bacterium]|nr:LysM peptidoglycan-binding domain-containing protein [Planctomycetota bacterium]
MKTRKAFMLIIVMFAVSVFVVPVNATEDAKPDKNGKVTASATTTVEVKGKEKTDDSTAPDAVEKADKAAKPEDTSKTNETTKAEKELKYENYTVKKGDTKESISKHFYGTIKEFPLIVKDNPEIEWDKPLKAGFALKIQIFEKPKTLKSVSITSADKINFELMKKAKKYDKKHELKVRRYIAKLDRNIYAKIDEIRKLMLEDSWDLESVKIPKKVEEKEENASENKPQDKDDPKIKKLTENKDKEPEKQNLIVNDNDENDSTVQPEFIEGIYRKRAVEYTDSELEKKLMKLNDVKYINVGIDVENGEELEEIKKVALKTVDSGFRMSTSTSVAVNRQMVALKKLIIEYHANLFEYLKYKYKNILNGIDIEEKTLPEANKDKEDNDNLTTKVAKIKTTTYCEIFESAWKIEWDKKQLKFNLEDAFMDVLEETKNRGESKLIHESDIKFVLSLENIIGIYGELEDKTLKATFRAGWDEFDLGWVMFIFGVLTLYGGLTWTILIDFRSRRKAKK